jgi:hypothetical protein
MRTIQPITEVASRQQLFTETSPPPSPPPEGSLGIAGAASARAEQTASIIIGSVIDRESARFASADAARLPCPLYAGPLRWRQHPGGQGARVQSLRALLWPSSSASASEHEHQPPLAAAPPTRALEPFSLRSLRLSSDRGPMAAAAETNARFLRSLDQDRLFWSFRKTAGLRQPNPRTQPFGGWERPGAGIRGHFVGHYLAALASGGAGGDEVLLSRATSALKVLVECQRAHTHRGARGYLSAFPPDEFDKAEGLWREPRYRNGWVPHYAVQKVRSGRSPPAAPACNSASGCRPAQTQPTPAPYLAATAGPERPFAPPHGAAAARSPPTGSRYGRVRLGAHKGLPIDARRHRLARAAQLRGGCPCGGA